MLPKENLLFITPSDKIGGGNRMMFELAARLSTRYHVTCAFPRSPSRPKYPLPASLTPLPLGWLSRSPWMIFPNLLLLLHWLRYQARRFSAIISTGQITGILLPYVRHPRLYNFIQTDEFLIFQQGHLEKRPMLYRIYSFLMRRSLKARGIGYIFNSEFSFQRFLQAVPDYSSRKVIIHPGVDPSVFHPHGRITASAPLRITSIGRRHFLKGLHILLRAHEELATAQFPPARWQMVCYDDPALLDLPPKFEILKPQNDAQLADILRHTHIYLSTSLWEGFGLPALEAMACGCAVITSDNGGCREYARPEENCLTYPPQDHRLLARHIVQLANDAGLRNTISANGPETARHFTWDRSAQRLMAFLKEAL